jgi:YVTN family beta-propeller protein
VRDVILVVQKGDHSLGYYDFETGSELARVAVDPYPHEFTLSADRRTAYLAHFGVALAEHGEAGGNTVSVVDIAAVRRIGTIDCGACRRPHDVAFDGSGRLYILSGGQSTLLIVPDPLTRKITQRIATGAHGSHILSVTHDGGVVFTSNMASNSVSALFPNTPDRTPVVIPVGSRPEGSVFDAEEEHLYVANRESAEISVIDVRRMKVVDTVPTPPGPVRVCRNKRQLFIALYHGCGLLMLDLDNPAYQQVVPLHAKAISVSVHPTRQTALLSTLAQNVCLVDIDSSRLVRTVPARSDPDPTVVVSLPI